MTPLEMPLRADYEVLLAPDNREYYYNRKTGESTFTKPDVLKGTDDVFEADPWTEHRSARGKVFYYNTITKESRWRRPHTKGRRPERTPLVGIGLELRITRFDTAKRFLYELLDQHEVRDTRDAVLRLSADVIFRSVEEQSRMSIIKSYLLEKEEERRNEENMKQSMYVEEICKIKVDARNFFEFNRVLDRHPYYTKIRNKFSCYESYIKGSSCGASAIDRVIEERCADLSASIEDVLDIEEFDKRDILMSFSRLMRSREQRYIEELRRGKHRRIMAALKHKRDFEGLLHVLYEKGLIYYKMKFKDAFYLFRREESFRGMLGSIFSAKDIFFDFMHALEGRLSQYERNYAMADISHTDRMAMKRYFDAISGEKEEGEI
jgi:pre-mRNA-processing factor 40